jgi:hypothetical protein
MGVTSLSDLMEIKSGFVDCIYLAQYTGPRQAFVNMVNFPQNDQNFW